MSDASPPTNLRWALRSSLLAAVALTLVLDLSVLTTSSPKFWRMYFFSVSFVADCLVVWLIVLLVIALTNRVMVSIGLLGGLFAVVAIANRIKLNLRYEPIYPSDKDFVSEPEFLTTMVSPTFLVVVALVVVAMVLGAVLLSRRYERRLLPIWPRQLDVKGRAVAVLSRAGVVAVCLSLLVAAGDFNDPGNGWKKLYELGAPGWRPWNQATNYAVHGFVGGFLYNMPTVAMPEPAGYSRATMDRLAAKYGAAADEINRSRTGSLDDTNVVVVLSESFSDPTRLEGFTLAEDPIPKTRALMQQTTSGTMMAQLYGGGTANMEFEVLTGESIGLFNPQMNSPYQMLVSHYDEYPSAVGWFAAHGHKPIAIHPYRAGMYKRQTVYDTFGFDEFIHDSTMSEQDRIDDSDFISDESAFDEVEKQIRENDDPLLVNLVTMQNHIPMDDSYDDPIEVDGLDGGEQDRVGNYARGLAHTDDALADFLADLKASDENTVVVFYGDHLPGIYGSGTKDHNGEHMYETPFFLWSNQTFPVRTLPVTSPIYFLPLLYEAANAPVPPYFALLQQLQGQVSALETGRVHTLDGTRRSLDDLSPAARALIDDARLVQYDFSIGKRYAVERMWPGSLG